MRFRLVSKSDPDTILTPQVTSDISRAEFVVTHAKWSAYKEVQRPRNQRNVELLPGSRFWNWGNKAANHDTRFFRFFALKYAGEIEGLLLLSLIPYPSRKSGVQPQFIGYVEYVESAPWNLSIYAGANARFGGVGESLIAAARQASLENGWEGRLGLHSLPEARGFYESLGFEKQCFDPVEKLDFYELTGYKPSRQ